MSNSVQFASTLLMEVDTCQRKAAKLVRRNSIALVSWNGLVRAIKVNVPCASHSFFDMEYEIYI